MIVVRIVLNNREILENDILMDLFLPNLLNFFWYAVVVSTVLTLSSWSTFIWMFCALLFSFKSSRVCVFVVSDNLLLLLVLNPWECSPTGNSFLLLKGVTKYTSLFPNGWMGRTLCVKWCPSLSCIVRKAWIYERNDRNEEWFVFCIFVMILFILFYFIQNTYLWMRKWDGLFKINPRNNFTTRRSSEWSVVCIVFVEITWN